MPRPFSSPSAIVLALAVAAAWIAGSPAPAMGAPPGIQIMQSPDSAITLGEATLDAPPEVVYAAISDLSQWPTIFPDIEKVVITSRQGDEARATMIGHDDHHDNLHFHNQPAARMIWFEDTGGRATVWLEMVVVPGPTHGSSVVHSRLYADVHGLASLVVSDNRVRTMREEKLGHDLGALRTFFRAPPAAVSQN